MFWRRSWRKSWSSALRTWRATHGTTVLLAERCAVLFSLKWSYASCIYCALWQTAPSSLIIHACNPLTCFQAAETLLERDGDFLVRDSSSAPRDYVLTCFWMNGPVHFKIIRVVLRPKMVGPCYRCQLVSLLLSSRTEVLPNHRKWIYRSIIEHLPKWKQQMSNPGFSKHQNSVRSTF